jgi:hypothetical protein
LKEKARVDGESGAPICGLAIVLAAEEVFARRLALVGESLRPVAAPPVLLAFRLRYEA